MAVTQKHLWRGLSLSRIYAIQQSPKCNEWTWRAGAEALGRQMYHTKKLEEISSILNNHSQEQQQHPASLQTVTQDMQPQRAQHDCEPEQEQNVEQNYEDEHKPKQLRREYLPQHFKPHQLLKNPTRTRIALPCMMPYCIEPFA